MKETALQVQSYGPGREHMLNEEKLIDDLVKGMPTYPIKEYFAQNPGFLKNSDILIIVKDTGADATVAILAANWSRSRDPRFLWIHFLHIAEKWHKSQAIRLALKQFLVEAIKEEPPAIVILRTRNPQSFAALSVFSYVPGTVLYPFLRSSPVPELLPKVRAIAEKLAPGRMLDEETGVLKNAAANAVVLYPTMPRTGKKWIDAHFQAHVTQKDFLLGCLFVHSEDAGKRLLRTFGITPPEKLNLT